MRKFAIFAVLAALVYTAAARGQKVGVAVLDLEPQGVAVSTAAVISEFVRGEFRNSERIDLIEKNKMEALLKQKAFEQTGCTESKCAAEAGTILNVDKMIIGTLGKLGQKFVLTLRVVDVKTARIEYQDREEKIVAEEDLNNLVPPLVARILPKIKLTGLGQALSQEQSPAAETGGLKVYSAPAGANIFVDGTDWGQTPRLVSPLEAGERSVLLTLDGYRNAERQVKVARGITASMNVTLEKVYGSIKVTSSPPGAGVYMDKVSKGLTGSTGLTVAGLSIRTYRLKVAKTGYENYEVEVTTAPDEVTEVNAVLNPKPGSIVITSTPSGANVMVDGTPRGNTPCSVTGLEPGSYSVKVEKTGYQDGEISVNIGAGQSVAKSIVLKKTPTSPSYPSPRGEGRVGLTPLGGGESRNEKDGSVLIEIPAGNFTMGSNDYDDEKPIHTVHLDKYY
ncbi:PEGA domain-containing protein, partial [candidate division TA06 bacterium]|nr:PEGA domain-containing protein [candidate division TA06 bacterium]